MDLNRIVRAISMISSRGMDLVCLMFFSFLRSRGGSLRALMTRELAEGTTETAAWRFLMVRRTVTRRPFYDAVSLAGTRQWWIECLGVVYPVTSRLSNVFTDLLRRQTERTDLGREGRGGTDLTSCGAEVNDLLFVGVELGSWRSVYQYLVREP
jgi:hypothetical protein